MSEQNQDAASNPTSLPDAPSMEWLRKQAKRRLAELRATTPGARLADAQFDLARQYGFPSWRALKAQLDSLTVEGRLFEAARTGDVALLEALLDEHPHGLHARNRPYAWSLLHVAAHNGRHAAVDLLLRRGLDVNSLEKGDDTSALHWAAAAGHVDVVRRLIAAGADVIGHGDDHELEVIGWATCWDGCDDAAHRAIVDLLVARGARHHIFSAIALDLDDEVRRILTADPAVLTKRMSRNESHQLPLHFAVRKNRPVMVTLLLEAGADPNATDDGGMPVTVYAASADVEPDVIAALARHGVRNIFTALATGDDATAERLLAAHGQGGTQDHADAGALHLLAKRGDARAVRWLLDHGADPNARWSHWDTDLTPLHLAAWQGHADVVHMLLTAGADPRIHDTKHDGDAIGWADHGGHAQIVQLLASHTAAS